MSEYDETQPIGQRADSRTDEATAVLDHTPEVQTFVAAMRDRLGDLSEEEREELLGGLEADLAERLAEGDADLGDPAAYAAELRAAAGLDERRPGKRPRVPPRQRFARFLDGSRERWDRSVESHPVVARGWQVARAAQPAWWVFRAWVAVQLLDMATGTRELLTVVPSFGGYHLGLVLLLGAVVVSVMVGSGQVWPGSKVDVSLLARTVLAGLNTFAVVVTFAILGEFPDTYDSHLLANGYIYEYADANVSPDRDPGLMSDGHRVRNVFAYDAKGRPLTGVQLFDQQGRPLAVDTDRRLRTADGIGVVYPWLNGGQQLFNVFPLPVRTQRGLSRDSSVWTTNQPPALPVAPLAVVPPVSLPTPPATDSGKSAGR